MGELDKRIRRLEGGDNESADQYGAWGESVESVNHRFEKWIESDPLATQEELDAQLAEIYRIYGVAE